MINTFDEWRKFKGYALDYNIEDMSETTKIRPLMSQLLVFMLQVIKKDVYFYLPTT
jgi:hypothetical protein